MATHIQELKAAAETGNREGSVAGQGMRSLESRLVTAENRGNTSDSGAYETLDKLFELWAFVNRLNLIVCGEFTRIAMPFRRGMNTRPAIYHCTLQRRGYGREELYSTHDGLPVKTSSDMPCLFVGLV